MTDTKPTSKQSDERRSRKEPHAAQRDIAEVSGADIDAPESGVDIDAPEVSGLRTEPGGADALQADLDASSGEANGTAGAFSSQSEAADVEGDLDELVAVAAQRDEYLALAQRTQADFENYRKRVARDSAAARERGLASLAKELLPALDNLDRALKDVGESEGGDERDPLVDGVRLVRSELDAALGRVGIESFGVPGETFDPAEHEAMSQRSVEGAESGTIVEVYQPGYRLGKHIIRPARVVVAT